MEIVCIVQDCKRRFLCTHRKTACQQAVLPRFFLAAKFLHWSVMIIENHLQHDDCWASASVSTLWCFCQWVGQAKTKTYKDDVCMLLVFTVDWLWQGVTDFLAEEELWDCSQGSGNSEIGADHARSDSKGSPLLLYICLPRSLNPRILHDPKSRSHRSYKNSRTG